MIENHKTRRAKVAEELLREKSRIVAEYAVILQKPQVTGTANDSTFSSFTDFLNFSLGSTADISLREVIGQSWPQRETDEIIGKKAFPTLSAD